MLARAQLRRRRAATVALVLLVGLGGGVVLASVAGASRTDSAMDRFVAYIASGPGWAARRVHPADALRSE
jgi:hypothetical protein